MTQLRPGYGLYFLCGYCRSSPLALCSLKRTPVRLPGKRDSYKEWLEDPRDVGQERSREGRYASADGFVKEEELGEGEALPQARALFSSHIQEDGVSILQVTRETDLTFLGEENDVHKGIFDMAGKCGGVFLSPHIPGFHLKKVCLWRHWAGRFQSAHPTLGGAVKQGAFPISTVLKSTFALPFALYRVGKALVAPQSTLTSLAWLVHLADNPEESLAWVPPSLPSRITAYRLDHLWDWMKKLDTTRLFPGWEVKAVGSAIFTEHRPAAYADGSWRFAHIDPRTLELARHPNGRFKNPFTLKGVWDRPSDDDQQRGLSNSDATGRSSRFFLGPAAMRFLVFHKKRFGFLSRLKGFGRTNATNSSMNGNTMNDRSDSLNPRTSVPDGDEGLSKYSWGDSTEESGEEDECGDTEVVEDATSVSYIRCGKVLKIHKSKCGAVPTFDYVSQSPYAVLLSPSSETRRSAKKWRATKGTDRHAEIDTQELRKHGWTIADAVWAFRPTTGSKVALRPTASDACYFVVND
ncbi:hypothetical protein Emag_000814 [Eimeria magna]